MWTRSVIISLLINCVYVQQPNSNNCECVQYYLCQANGTIITNGDGLIDERFGEQCQSCKCTDPLEVCCMLNTANDVENRHSNKPKSTCGYSNPNGVGFRIGDEGSDALFGEFPWIIQIFENNKYRCGGSLILPNVVLTAAHCVKKVKRTFKVIAGEWDTSQKNQLLPTQERPVASIKIHEHFNPRNDFNDIALLFLNEPFKIDQHINVTCLISPNTIVASKERCYAIGWGVSTYELNSKKAKILKKIDLPILDQSTCQSQLRKTRLGQYFELNKSFICAGSEKGKDTCIGDGGGPLFCPIEGEDDRYEQVGIVSWGIECNIENVPGVYANISHLRQWIDKQIALKNLDISSYDRNWNSS